MSNTYDYEEAENQLQEYFKSNGIADDKQFPAYKHSEINPNSNYTLVEGETIAKDQKRWLALVVRRKYTNPVQKSKHLKGDDSIEPKLEIIQYYWIFRGGAWKVNQWCNIAIQDIDMDQYTKVYKSLKEKYFQ